MFTYNKLVFVALIALITSFSAPSFAAPDYHNGGPSCVEDNGFGPQEGGC